MNKHLNKESLISFAILFMIIGGGLFLVGKRVMCVPIVNECYFVIKGDSVLDAMGTKLNSTAATVIKSSGYFVLGLGGIFLLAGLVKSDDK